ncbi:MAG: hypothetical protein AAGJ81_08750 [Verrucomicrobiota bacterium]
MAASAGLEILKDRISQIPQFLAETFDSVFPHPEKLRSSSGVVATGLGSSEAAARYLVRLLNEWTSIPAEFLPLNRFYQSKPAEENSRYLIVFTQGLAPNAQIALARRESYSGLTLITSSTTKGQRAAGKPDRADLLEKVREEGATIFCHPFENEFEILPRVIGPVCTMASALLIGSSLSERNIPVGEILSFFEHPPLDDLTTDKLAAEILAGVDFYFTDLTVLYAQNLSAKILETLFLRAPSCRDVFDYSHGPFQAETQNPSSRWIFSSQSQADHTLLKEIGPLFDRINPARAFSSPLPEPYSIFYYESLLNQITLQAAAEYGVDLVDWPGKGLDKEGYSLASPFEEKEMES